MREGLNCQIVQDLLPNYIENLTSDITNQAIEEHISGCQECNELINILSAEITTKKFAPKRELKFLKKIKLTKLIAAISCILLALILSYLLYASEYKFINDKQVLSDGITQYISDNPHKVLDAYVLETKEVDGVLIAFFKDNKDSNVYGFAQLVKGVNLKYRFVSVGFNPSHYSAIVDTHRFETSKGVYYGIGGYNLDENITSYGLRLYDVNRGDLTRDMLKFKVENSQFLDVRKESDLQKSVKELELKGNPIFYGAYNTALLDVEGKDITENYRIPNITDTWSTSTATAESFMLYVFIAIVLIIGAILARYFWSEG